MIEYKFSNITLKIQGKGNQNVLNHYFFLYIKKPDIIYINGVEQTEINS